MAGAATVLAPYGALKGALSQSPTLPLTEPFKRTFNLQQYYRGHTIIITLIDPFKGTPRLILKAPRL